MARNVEHVPMLVQGEAYTGVACLSVDQRDRLLEAGVNTGLAFLKSSVRMISPASTRRTMPPTAAPMATPATSPSESPDESVEGRATVGSEGGEGGEGGGGGEGGNVHVGCSPSEPRAVLRTPRSAGLN